MRRRRIRRARAPASASRWPRPRRSCAATASTAATACARCTSSSCSPRIRRRRPGARCSTTSRRPPSCSTRSTTRAPASRRRALLDELREILTIWWQTDEVRRARPHVEDEVRRNLFFFESTLYDAVPEVLDELERAFGVRVELPVLAFGSLGGLGHGRPSRGRAPRRWRARCGCTARRRCGCCATASRGSRARFSHSDRRVAVSPRSRRRWPATRRSSRPPRAAPRPPRVGAAAHQAGLRRAPADQHARPRRARARLRRPDELRADLALVRDSLGSDHVARGAIRRLLCQVDVFGFHLAAWTCASPPPSCARPSRALLPGFASARARRSGGAARRGDRDGRARARPPARRRRRRAGARARHGRAGRRGLRPRGRPGVVISMVERPSDVLAALWLAHRAGRADGRAAPAARAAVRDARRPRARAGDHGDAVRAARRTATPCARTATGRR